MPTKVRKISDMYPVKYQRFIPVATVIASLALLTGCVFAATSGSPGISGKISPAMISTITDSSPDSFTSALVSMKNRGGEDKRYEVGNASKDITVSVFGGDGNDIEKARRFTEIAGANADMLDEARLSEYDAEANIPGYEGSMFLKMKSDASLDDSLRALRSFSGFPSNITLLAGNPRVQFLSISPDSASEIFTVAGQLSERLQDRIGGDGFSLSVHAGKKEISVVRHTGSSSVSRQETRMELDGALSGIDIPSGWKVVS